MTIMKLLRYIVCACALLSWNVVLSQELRCRVTVQYSDIPDADKDLFNNLSKTIEEFMNTRVWTESKFEEHEKIEMRLSLRITKQYSNKNFAGTLQIQSSRPVYNSTYTTTIFNHFDDKFNFQYEENQSIELSETSYISNLSSVLSFYAFLVLGLDFDTYSNQGGTLYFQKAQNIASAANASNETGWLSNEKENRYWLIENILNSTYAGYRSALYLYHRQGLDNMSDKADEGRKQVLEAIAELEKVYRVRPSALLLNVFFMSKKDEILQIFSEGTPEEKQRINTLAKKLNPANAAEYDKLIK